MLKKVRVGNINNDVEKLLKATFTSESAEKQLKDPLHLYTENKPGLKRNEPVLNNLPG